MIWGTLDSGLPQTRVLSTNSREDREGSAVYRETRSKVQAIEREDSRDIQKEYTKRKAVSWYASGSLRLHPILLQEG